MTIPTRHPEVIKRLKRASSHLKSIVTMLEEGSGGLAVAHSYWL